MIQSILAPTPTHDAIVCPGIIGGPPGLISEWLCLSETAATVTCVAESIQLTRFARTLWDTLFYFQYFALMETLFGFISFMNLLHLQHD